MSEARGGVSASLRQRVDASQREGAEASTGLIPSRTIGDLVDEIAQVLGAGCVPEPGRFSRVYGADVSLDALAVARRNVERAERLLRAPVELVAGSLLHPLLHLRARAIVSNPPYIAFGEAGALPASVRDWEPPAALFAGHDGLAATTALVRQAIDVLEPGGVLAMEVDSQRAPLVAELVAHDPRYDHVRVERDLTGRERFVLARRQETDG